MNSPIVIHGRERSVEEEMALLRAFADALPLFRHHADALRLGATALVQTKGAGAYDVEAWAALWRLVYDAAGKAYKASTGYTPLPEARQRLAVARALAERELAKHAGAADPGAVVPEGMSLLGHYLRRLLPLALLALALTPTCLN